MPYTEEQLDRLNSTPEGQRQYFWQCAKLAEVRASRARNSAARLEGPERDRAILTAQREELLATVVLNNLDAFVAQQD